jgi:hypothetical protein
LRANGDARAPGAEAREVDYTLSSDSYFCDDHALESAVPDEERDNADAPLQPEVDRVEHLTDRILLQQEIGLVQTLAHESVPGADLVGTGADWSDEGNDPVAAVEAARAAIIAAVQQPPNTLVLPQAVYTALRHHPAIVDRIRYSQLGVVGPGVLAELLDVERVLIARAMRNTAPRGAAPVLVPVWGRDAMLAYIPARPSLKCIAPVLTFTWSQAVGSSRGTIVQTWREERRKATMVRVQKYYDHKRVAPGAAWMFRNAIA